MSGTSLDGIDAALVRCDNNTTTLIATHQHPLTQTLQHQIADLSATGANEIERLGPLDRKLGAQFADAALELLASAGVSKENIVAIGSHGQTIRHRPPSGGHSRDKSFTLQIGDPSTIAEITGITTVADFRRRDIAAGGEGAPLAPAFHAAMLAAGNSNRGIVNIGGFANVSLLRGEELLAGFDTGPGNTLLDSWAAQTLGKPYDEAGNFAASGDVDPDLLRKLLQHPYLTTPGARSTGKEHFNLPWLQQILAQLPPLAPENVQATLAEFTAQTIAEAINTASINVDDVYLCGGGVHNADLRQRIARLVAPTAVSSTAALGVDPDWVEAMAFAWLAARCLQGQAGNAPQVTGAAGPRTLGGIYPA